MVNFEQAGLVVSAPNVFFRAVPSIYLKMLVLGTRGEGAEIRFPINLLRGNVRVEKRGDEGACVLLARCWTTGWFIRVFTHSCVVGATMLVIR